MESSFPLLQETSPSAGTAGTLATSFALRSSPRPTAPTAADDHDPSDGNHCMTAHCHLNAQQSGLPVIYGMIKIDQVNQRDGVTWRTELTRNQGVTRRVSGMLPWSGGDAGCVVHPTRNETHGPRTAR